MNDFYSLLQKINCHGKHVGPRGKLTKEIEDIKLRIDKYNFMSTPIHRPFEFIYKYWHAETCWYMSGARQIENILPYSKFWSHISNPDGTANSNYGNLVFYKNNSHGWTMFGAACKALEDDIYSRRGIIPYADPEYIYPQNNDYICTQAMHLKIREEKLNCTVFLRSSDALYGLYFNCPWWSLVHQQAFLRLRKTHHNLQLGIIKVNISSAHYYEPHFGLVEKILENRPKNYFIRWDEELPLGRSFEWYQSHLEEFFTVEPIDEYSSMLNFDESPNLEF